MVTFGSVLRDDGEHDLKIARLEGGEHAPTRFIDDLFSVQINARNFITLFLYNLLPLRHDSSIK